MDTKTITAVIIGLMVSGVILVAFVPIFTEVTATEKTFDNGADALGYVSTITSESDYTFAWTPGDDSISINGETVDLFANGTVVCKSGSTMVRYTNGYFQCWNPNLITIGGPDQAFNLSITNGVMTISGEDITTITADMTGGFILASEGDYVMKSPTQKAYVLKDSSITAMGVTTMTGNVNTAITITGTPMGVEVDKIYPTNVDFTFTDVNISKTEVSGFNDLYQIEKITFTATDENSNTTNCTYNYFIVPSKVTAEHSVHGDDAFNAIINLIPLLAGVGLLMFGVYYFISRK